MARYKQAPEDYVCPYRHRCPHLSDMSTQWVLGRYDEAEQLDFNYWRMSEEYEEELLKLSEELEEAERKIAELDGTLQRKGWTKNVVVIEPVGYLDMLVLEENAHSILTENSEKWLTVPLKIKRKYLKKIKDAGVSKAF